MTFFYGTFVKRNDIEGFSDRLSPSKYFRKI